MYTCDVCVCMCRVGGGGGGGVEVRCIWEGFYLFTLSMHV